MSLVKGNNITLTFLGRELFNKIDFQVEPGDRLGLVGPNGSGKTTLLRLLMNEVSPESGEIRISKGTRIGYLPQDIQEALSGTLLQAVLDSVPGRLSLREEISIMERSLEEKLKVEEQAKLAARLAQSHQHMNDLDSRFPLHRAEKILLGLGFKPDDFDKPIDSLSGGWKTRAALGSMLYQKPDLLLMDEPTNHLDIPSIRWLEDFLQDYTGALILVCHDRDFLNRQIKRVLSLEPEGLRAYTGNYDAYLKIREEEEKILEARARNQEQKRKEAQKFIERFKAKASKARQAQSKIKLVKKMAMVETYTSRKTVHFSFPEVPRSGKDALAIRGVSKGFGENILYRDLDLKVFRGERVAVIGPNGAGKTTLLRMAAGELEPDEGQIDLGHGVSLRYYAQHLSEMLNAKRTIIEEVYQAVPHETIGFVRGVCGAFLFSGEDVDKSVGVLSGGEKARVSLAKILVRPGNLLVMDEPTNHLDIISSEILIDALHDFNGTLFFVSHNQSFVNRLATKIWDLREGTIFEYPGKLYEYYEHLSRLAEFPESPGRESVSISEDNEKESDGNRLHSRKILRREKAEKRRLINDRLNPIRHKLGDLEDRIDQLEERKNGLEKRLADPDIFRDKEKSLPLLKEYTEVKNKIEGLMGRWEFQHQKLESAEEELGIGDS